jgi:alpha-galactosidase
VVYLQPVPGNNLVLAFTSCRRFAGKFHLRPSSIEIALDGDGIEVAPGQTIDLEEFAVLEGSEHGPLFDQLAARLGENHPPILGPTPPEGWCSWYCFGPEVTARQVMENLEFIAEHFPALRYIQIDDGYQAAMGDWLATGKAFGGDVRAVLRQIRERGFEPAIWVAPFIAEAGSQVFQQHPDWFMKDAQGQPLAADQVTFGGWRRGPWYAMDGSHPQVQEHLESIFRTMREEWGVTYFKLDANYWGTMPQGQLHDPAATRIEAYRRGMEAVRRGAGNAFLLGCNHPLWPSLGLIHGSRSSNDIRRSWDRFRQTARENLHRNWQNGRLWWNDPDVVLLTGDLSDDEFHFHAAAIYASGGMFLAGDDLPRLPAARLEMLRKLSPPTAQAAVFDPELRVGRARHNSRELIFFFNWNDAPESFEAQVPANATVTDFWTGEAVVAQGGKIQIADVAPHAARILVV